MPPSILEKYKVQHGPLVIPVGAVDDSPPDYEDGDTRPFQIDKLTGGLKVYIVNGDNGDGATEAKQNEQIAQLADIVTNTTGLATEITLDLIRSAVESSGATLSTIASTVATEATAIQIRNAITALGDGKSLSDIWETLTGVATEDTAQLILTALGPLATSLDVQDVTSAIAQLGGGSTVDDVVSALTPLASAATEATALALLTSMQAVELDVDVIRSTLITIEDEVDDLEAINQRIDNNTKPSATSPSNYNVTPTSTTTALASLVCRGVLLMADEGNTATIYVGGPDVNVSVLPRVGTPLKREDSIYYPAENANLIYHACSTASQVLRVEVIK